MASRSPLSFVQEGFLPQGKLPQPPGTNERAYSAFGIAKRLGCAIRQANDSDLLFSHELMPHARKVPHSVHRPDVSRILRVYLKHVHEAVVAWQSANIPVLVGGGTETGGRLGEVFAAATDVTYKEAAPVDLSTEEVVHRNGTARSEEFTTPEGGITAAGRFFREMANHRHYRFHGQVFKTLEDCAEPECMKACQMLTALTSSADEVDQIASELLHAMEENGVLRRDLRLARDDAHQAKVKMGNYEKAEELKVAQAAPALTVAKPGGGEPYSDSPTAGLGFTLFGKDLELHESDTLEERRRKVRTMHLVVFGELEGCWAGGRSVLTRSGEAIEIFAERRHYDAKVAQCYYDLDFSRWKLHLMEIKRNAESQHSMIGGRGWEMLMVSLKRVQQKALSRRNRTMPQPSPA